MNTAAYMRRWRRQNPEAARAIDRKKLYGLDRSAFEQLWADQDGLCAACQGAMERQGKCNVCVSVDHSHDTGQVRGLLCNRCNKTAGASGDDPERLRMIAAYLEKH